MRTVQIQNDALGIEAFKTVSASIRQQTVDKGVLTRLDRIAAVFDHRTTIAINVEAESDTWARRSLETRLSVFKKPAFFIEAAQSLLTEMRTINQARLQVEAEKRKKRSLQVGWYR